MSAPIPSATASQRTIRRRAPNVKWSKDDVDLVLDRLRQAQDEGNTSENGFKETVWQSISESFVDALKTGRCCQSKWSRIKGEYKEVKFLREASGFGWDEDRCVPTAEEQVWEDLLTVRFYSRYITIGRSLISCSGTPEHFLSGVIPLFPGLTRSSHYWVKPWMPVPFPSSSASKNRTTKTSMGR